jgi:hypothetical protein
MQAGRSAPFDKFNRMLDVTGPEFLGALKTAVLYSEQVHVLTLCNVSVLSHLLGKTLVDATLVELRPCIREGVATCYCGSASFHAARLFASS